MSKLEFDVGKYHVLAELTKKRWDEDSDMDAIAHISSVHYLVNDGDKYTFGWLKDSPDYNTRRSFIEFSLALSERKPNLLARLLEQDSPIFYLDAHEADGQCPWGYCDDNDQPVPLEKKLEEMQREGAKAAILKCCNSRSQALNAPIPTIYPLGKIPQRHLFFKGWNVGLSGASAQKFTIPRKKILLGYLESLAIFDRILEKDDITQPPSVIWRIMQGKRFKEIIEKLKQ